MSDLEAFARIRAEAKDRMATLQRGQPVTNVCAGETNPGRHCYFVEYVIKSYTNKYGIEHHDYWARCRDKKGKKWLTGIEVVFPGHLDYAECRKIFKPIWEAQFGKSKPSPPVSA